MGTDASVGGLPSEVDGLTPEVLTTMRKQETLEPAASIIVEAASNSPNSGYGNLAFNEDDDGLILYWKGALTPDMKVALQRARAIGPVAVVPARYSLEELKAAAARIESAGFGGSDMQEISYEPDSSGLRIETMPAAVAAKAETRAGGHLTPAEQVVARSGVTVPVTVATASAPVERLSCNGSCGRRDDESPWNSGTKMYWSNGENCTSGFAVYYQGRTWLLTAAHCATWFAGGADYAVDGAGEFIGAATPAEDWMRDIILVDAAGWHWMWYGSTVTSNYRVVTNFGYRITGQLMCQSGAATGSICGLETQAGTYANWGCDSDHDCFVMYDLGKVICASGCTAGSPGDSGGPLFTLTSDGVRAKGTVSAGGGSVLYYATMDTILSGRGGSSPWPAGITVRLG